MPKYNLVDEKNNTVIGFAVIHSEVMTEFQSVATGGSKAGALGAAGPVAEGVLFVMVLGGSAAMVLTASGPGWLAASVGIGGALIVSGFRAWRSGLPQEKPGEAQVIVRGEFKASEGTVYFDEITEKRIRFSTLQKVCRAVVNNNFEWMGRPTMMVKAGISRGQYDLIRSEFSRLNYFGDGEGNTVEMAGRGRLFVRKVFEYDRRKNGIS